LFARNKKAGGALACTSPQRMEHKMDREHVKGAVDKVKGAVKDLAGKLTGDEKLQAEGKLDKAKGAAHNLAGDAKDTAREGIDAAHKAARDASDH
jgi:uncharacterized protein YjbJ (UPF0337 family)